MTYFPTRAVAGVGQTTSPRYLVVHRVLCSLIDLCPGLFVGTVSHSRNRENTQRQHRHSDDDVFVSYHHAICCQALSAPEFSIGAAITCRLGQGASEQRRRTPPPHPHSSTTIAGENRIVFVAHKARVQRVVLSDRAPKKRKPRPR